MTPSSVTFVSLPKYFFYNTALVLVEQTLLPLLVLFRRPALRYYIFLCRHYKNRPCPLRTCCIQLSGHLLIPYRVFVYLDVDRILLLVSQTVSNDCLRRLLLTHSSHHYNSGFTVGNSRLLRVLRKVSIVFRRYPQFTLYLCTDIGFNLVHFRSPLPIHYYRPRSFSIFLFVWSSSFKKCTRFYFVGTFAISIWYFSFPFIALATVLGSVLLVATVFLFSQRRVHVTSHLCEGLVARVKVLKKFFLNFITCPWTPLSVSTATHSDQTGFLVSLNCFPDNLRH